MAGQIITQHLSLLTILFCAYFIRGIAGFGSGLIAIPLLALSHPLPFAVPLILALDFIASLALTRTDQKLASWPEVRSLLPFGLLGGLLGAFLLMRFPASGLMLLLGMLAVLVGLMDVLGLRPNTPISRRWAIPTGLLGGCAGALFGTSAPPYIIYLSQRLPDKSALRATFSLLFLIDGSFRLLLFAVAGLLLTSDTLRAICLGLVPMAIGLYLGHRVHVDLTQKSMQRLIGIILLGSGSALLLKALA